MTRSKTRSKRAHIDARPKSLVHRRDPRESIDAHQGPHGHVSRETHIEAPQGSRSTRSNQAHIDVPRASYIDAAQIDAHQGPHYKFQGRPTSTRPKIAGIDRAQGRSHPRHGSVLDFNKSSLRLSSFPVLIQFRPATQCSTQCSAFQQAKPPEIPHTARD